MFHAINNRDSVQTTVQKLLRTTNISTVEGHTGPVRGANDRKLMIHTHTLAVATRKLARKETRG